MVKAAPSSLAGSGYRFRHNVLWPPGLPIFQTSVGTSRWTLNAQTRYKLWRMRSGEQSRDAEDIIYTNCSTGLGIKIVGGCSEDGTKNYGIFVKKVLAGGLAADDGRLHEMDQVLEVNGESLLHVTNERAVSLLRVASASNYVHLKVCRDLFTREEYKQLTERQSGSSGSECNSIPSRTNTPSFFDKQLLNQNERASYEEQELIAVQGQRTVSPPADQPASAPDALHSAEFDQASSVDVQPTAADAGRTEDTDGATKLLMMKRRLHLQPAMSSTPQYAADHVAGGHVDPVMSPVGLQSTSPGATDIPSPVLPTSGLQRTVPSTMSPDLHVPSQSTYNSASMSQEGALSPSHEYSQSNRSTINQKSGSMSIDPQIRLRVDKLQMALKYLGCEPTPEESIQMRKLLDIDEKGTVSYGDFVQAAREVLKFQLKEKHFSPGATFTATNPDMTDLSQPTSPQGYVAVDTCDASPTDELMQVRHERDALLREVDRLKCVLQEKERACTLAEEELLRVRREAQGAIHESRSLRSKVHLAEQAQRAARSMEQDYEEVVRLLENEIAQLRANSNRHMDSPAVQKRLAVLGTQLRKSEISKKTYEVATEKLLHFAEVVHSTLTSQGDGNSLTRGDKNRGEPPRGNQPPGFLGKHKRHSASTLATEAKEVVRAVKSLIDVDPLPFGWDEAYTADGTKYYINHVTQTTSWTHPVSNVEHISTATDHDRQGSSPESRT